MSGLHRWDEEDLAKLVRAAKAWFRADESNLGRREERLRKAVSRYIEAEKEWRELRKSREIHRDAAESGEWLNSQGQRTPYASLSGEELHTIRRMIDVDSPHHQKIAEEVHRRACFSALPVLWAAGIPYVHESTTGDGDRVKFSFRNCLTGRTDHVVADSEDFVISWTGKLAGGLDEQSARILHEAVVNRSIENPKV